MWTYQQKTGFIDHDGQTVSVGYAGKGAGKNNPDMQCEHGIGPLPRGLYTINPPVDTHTHGPYVMWLTPDTGNDMCGRSAFGIHGDSVVDPGNASEGCICTALGVRKTIWQSGDTRLEVV